MPDLTECGSRRKTRTPLLRAFSYLFGVNDFAQLKMEQHEIKKIVVHRGPGHMGRRPLDPPILYFKNVIAIDLIRTFSSFIPLTRKVIHKISP